MPDPYVGEDEYVNAMKWFDGLPANQRFCMNYHNRPRTYEDEDIIQNRAMDTYGPDHPQAQGHFCYPMKR